MKELPSLAERLEAESNRHLGRATADDEHLTVQLMLLAAAKALREQESALEKALDALIFYGDPDTYFAMSVLFDPPCGEFREDFSEDHGSDLYERPMPGKRARQVLREILTQLGDSAQGESDSSAEAKG